DRHAGRNRELRQGKAEEPRSRRSGLGGEPTRRRSLRRRVAVPARSVARPPANERSDAGIARDESTLRPTRNVQPQPSVQRSRRMPRGRLGAAVAPVLLLAVAAQLAIAPAHAALFDDDEARKRIELLKSRVDQLESSLSA